jgi:hypothetical protein
MTLALIFATDINVLALLVTLLVLGAVTLTDKLEALFRAHPGEWIDSWRLLRTAGHCGWRSRLTDLRHRGFQVENRMRRVKGTDGQKFTISEYRWTPESLLDVAEGAADSTQDSTTEATC